MRGDRIGMLMIALGAVAAVVVLIGCGGDSTAIKTMGIPIFLKDANGNDTNVIRSGATQTLNLQSAGLPATVGLTYTGGLSGPATTSLSGGSYPITITAPTVTSPTIGTVNINNGQYIATLTITP